MTLLAALALFVSAALLVRQRFRLRADESVLAGCLLAFLEIVVMMQALGLAGQLRPVPVWTVTVSCVAVNLFIAFRRTPFRPIRKMWPMPRLLWPALVGLVAILGLRLYLAWRVPPEGWDSLGYHLPIVWRWVQQGNFDLAGWFGPARYFAWNGELTSAWLALLGSGSLAFAKIPQVLCLPLLAAAGAVLGRRLAGVRWAWAVAIAFPALPIVLIQSGLFYVDSLHASFWLASVAALVGWMQSGRKAHFWAFAAACGLSAGVKSTVYYLAPLVLLLAAALWVRRKKSSPSLGTWLLGLALIVLAGAGSYIRNWVLTGNPIYPFSFSFAGLIIFKGIASTGDMPAYIEHWFVPSSWAWIIYPFWERFQGIMRYTHLNGFGPLFALGWLLLPVAFWRAWKQRRAVVLACLSLIPLVLLLFFTLQPVRIPRYIIFLAPLPIVGLAVTFRRARGRLRRTVLILWSVTILMGCAGVLAYHCTPGMLSVGLKARQLTKADAWEYYEKQYPGLGRAWQALDQRLKAGDVVAVNYGELLLPWGGIPLRSIVRVVALSESSYPQILCGRTPEEWLAELERLGPRYVVVWSPAWVSKQGGRERQAVLSQPERFKQLGRWQSTEIGWVEIYKVKIGAIR